MSGNANPMMIAGNIIKDLSAVVLMGTVGRAMINQLDLIQVN